ncbi:MAG: hypothetical protein K8R90_03640 [Candidatus Cloacimonetes bacterium]|nr:hypothetical protein [Candidatus Cloacimonadota bacterium]
MIGVGEIAQIAASSAMDQGHAMANMAGLGATEAQALAIDTVMNAQAYKNSVGQSIQPQFSTYSSQGALGGQVVNATLNKMQGGFGYGMQQQSEAFNREILGAVYG